MSELSRELLYPLGYISAILFGSRFLVQWLNSEKQKRSVVSPIFWWLSIAGNISLFIHSTIQLQYHVSVVQACNTVISWRNLNLMQSKEKQFSFWTVVLLLVGAIISVTSFFILEGGEWFRIPNNYWGSSIPTAWHIIGFTGILLFASRFWVQWWCAEIHRKSYLGKSFWWLSLIGDILMLSYFFKINDPVNMIGPLFGLIPYIRNLMLLRQEEA
jgi:lipid-A-disaccharide synthase-like uncharacterized protein